MNKFVRCAICGELLEQLPESHLMTHGLTFREYRQRFPQEPTISEDVRAKLKKAAARTRRRQNDPESSVVCQLCGAVLREVTGKHLRYQHGIDRIRYCELFPDSPVMSKAARKSRSEAAKANNADPARRKRQAERMRGPNNPFFGKKHDEQTRELMSTKVQAAWEREHEALSEIRREVGQRLSAENSPRWKGGYKAGVHGGSKKYRARRRAMRVYGERCIVPECDFDFVVHNHHIVPRSEGGSDELDNCILLCPNHHALADAGVLTRDYLCSLAQTAPRAGDKPSPDSP